MEAASALDLTPVRVRSRPFEHLLVRDFIAPEIYRGLLRSFPVCPPSTGPSGYSCYWGDPVYQTLITEYASWRALFSAVQSQDYVDYCVRQFRTAFAAHNCTIDLAKARYVVYRESREDKERRHILNPIHAPHDLWVRMDIHQGQVGYSRARHLDHRRRLVSMLIYLCDADENAMEGGDLVLHPRPGGWLPRHDAVVRPRHNLMAAFACHPASHHSVPAIVSQRAPRNFLQITVSSSIDAWPS